MTNSHLRVLLLEDRVEDADLLLRELRRAGFQVDWSRVESRDDYVAALGERPDIILADYSLPQFDALSALRLLSEGGLDIPVIVVTGVMSEETCVQSLRHGAIDYLLKDRLTRLGPAVEHALAAVQLRRERQQAERDAERSAAVLRGVVESAPSGMYLKDNDGRYLLVNSEYERLFGLPHGCTIGRTDQELVAPAVAMDIARRDAHCRRRRAIIEQEEWLDDPVGSHTYLSVRYPLLDSAGAVYAIGAIYTDITRQKRVEADLRNTRTALQQQTGRLEQANAELLDMDRAKSDFIASVSHELRTPLTSIRGYTEMLAAGDLGELSPAERRIIAIIDRNGRRLLSLIDDLLTVFRIDRGAFTLDLRPVNLRAVVASVHTSVEPTLPKGLTLDLQVAQDVPEVIGDPHQIERALLNLVTNAVKFSPDGGTVTIAASATERGVRLSVRDPGIGIPASEQHKLFARFGRANAAQERAIPGTGLGLSITKDIVERHGGQITLNSTDGGGTTVTFTLPLCPGAVLAAGTVENPQPSEQPT
jgi:PAS domain S-box-containing protein